MVFYIEFNSNFYRNLLKKRIAVFNNQISDFYCLFHILKNHNFIEKFNN